VTMMVPDRQAIMKVKLASQGYQTNDALSKKFFTLYKLCEEQLSKQRHYDFGLRNILSVLRTAGVNLRIELNKNLQQPKIDLEEMLMMRTLRDMNLSKLVADDVELFISLLHDIFPSQKDPEKRRYDAEEEALRKMIEKQGLVHHESWVNKIVQLYETSLVRHGLMMVGPAGSGKTTATRVLLEALSEVSDKHQMVRMNPKAITAEQMFGQNDVISGEWTHGIFSSLWAKYNDIRKHRTWIVCDGPVDAIWIENLNTVLDDNKLLTLANGDRVPMTDNVRLLFEVENLANASPATVSRAGIVYVSGTDLGYAPLVQAWLRRRLQGKTSEEGGEVKVSSGPNQARETEVPILERLYQKYIEAPSTLDWLNKNCTQVLPMLATHTVVNLLTLLEALLVEAVDQQKCYPEDALERIFIYAMFWSVGALLEQDDRVKMHKFLASLAGPFMPPAAVDKGETGYEFYVKMSTPTLEWARWEAPVWSYPAERFQFSTCLVPTVDSARAEFLIDRCMHKLHHPVLLVGSSGTAKTSIALQYMLGQAGATNPLLLKKVNFSSATTAGMFQTSIEADIEKRQGKTYAPSGGRLLTVFLDDLSMPEVNKWGDQPTLEIVRQLIETGGTISWRRISAATA